MNSSPEMTGNDTRSFESTFSRVVDGLPALVTVMTAEGKLQSANQRVLEYFGSTLEELRTLASDSTLHPDDRAAAHAAWDEAVRTGNLYDFEARQRRSDGAYRWFHLRGFPLRDPEGRVALWSLLQTDIEKRKWVEALLAGERLILEMMATGKPLTATLTELCLLVERLCPECVGCSILLLDSATKRLWHAASPSVPKAYTEPIDGFLIGPDVSCCGTAAFHCKQIVASDIATDPKWTEFRDVAMNNGLRACWSTPILSKQNRVLGTFAMFARDPRVPDEDDQEVIAQITRLASIAIERTRNETALKGSETRKAAIFNSALDCIVTIDHEGLITEFNPAAEHTFGCSRDEVMGQSLADVIIPPSLRERHRQGFARYLATGEARILGKRIEMTAMRADGSEFPVELAITRIPLDGPPSFTGYLRDITERKRSEKELLRSEAYLAEAQKLSLTGSFGWNLSTNEIYWSDETFRIFQCDLSVKVTMETVLKQIHPEDLPMVQGIIERASHDRKEWEFEHRLLMPNGTMKHVHVVAHSVESKTGDREFVGAVQDITGSKLDEKKLRDSELNLRQMTETIPEMLWSASADGAIDYCNSRLLDYTGFLAEEVMGNGWIKLIHPDDLERAGRAWASSIDTGCPYRVEVRTFHASDRTYRWCVTNALPLLDDEGRILKWHGTVVDMHNWKKAQEELRNAQANLARVSRLTTVGELTASIAHEVNQPLAAVVTNANACLRWLDHEPPNLEEVRAAIRRIVRDGNRGGEVITRIRGLVKKENAPKELFNVNDVVRETVALVQMDLQGITFRIELENEMPLVHADRVQMQQVLLNLAMNAIDAMKLATERPHVLLIQTKHHPEQGAQIIVRDSGVGLDPEATEKLFETFYTTKAEGLGMGLSICRSIIEGHGGRLWAECNEGHGATFQFNLPVNSGVEA